jgi:NADH:ubiquinone reductase (H+-translocating)
MALLNRQAQSDVTVAKPRFEVEAIRAGAPGIGESLHRIVVVGGGAAGLELVTRLGDRLGRRRRASITLVECARTHLWKPLLHAVAAGSIDPGEYEVNYLAQAHWHGFRISLRNSL